MENEEKKMVSCKPKIVHNFVGKKTKSRFR